MKKIYILLIIVMPSLLLSCRKKELPVPMPDKGDVITAFSDLGADYKKQMYFDLGTNRNVGENLKVIWDLGVSNNSERIILNAAKVMYAAAITSKTFEQITDTLGFEAIKRWDTASGHADSFAIKTENLYLVDRGIDEAGNPQGWFKFQILDNNETHFKGRFAMLDGSNDHLISFSKNPNYNYTHLSMNGQVHEVLVQPEKEKWDLVITQYVHVYWMPEFFPYIVVGVLANPSGDVKMLEVTGQKDFASIDYSYANALTLKPDWNQIGFNWKTFDGSTYSISSNRTWIIEDNEGYLYKFRLIDFYNANGLKGCPTFEYQRL